MWNVIKVWMSRFFSFEVNKKPMIKCLFGSQSSQNHHKVKRRNAIGTLPHIPTIVHSLFSLKMVRLCFYGAIFILEIKTPNVLQNGLIRWQCANNKSIWHLNRQTIFVPALLRQCNSIQSSNSISIDILLPATVHVWLTMAPYEWTAFVAMFVTANAFNMFFLMRLHFIWFCFTSFIFAAIHRRQCIAIRTIDCCSASNSKHLFKHHRWHLCRAQK